MVKKIHYCWFGGKKLPKSVEDCIKTWKKFLPDYEIKQWDESNFDVNSFLNTVYLACSYCVILLRAVGGREGNQASLYRNRIIAVSL